MTPRPRPVFFTEDGYKVHLSPTHPAARLPYHWTVVLDGYGVIGSGRSRDEAYGKHDARTAIREHKAKLEQGRAA